MLYDSEVGRLYARIPRAHKLRDSRKNIKALKLGIELIIKIAKLNKREAYGVCNNRWAFLFFDANILDCPLKRENVARAKESASPSEYFPVLRNIARYHRISSPEEELLRELPELLVGKNQNASAIIVNIC